MKFLQVVTHYLFLISTSGWICKHLQTAFGRLKCLWNTPRALKKKSANPKCIIWSTKLLHTFPSSLCLSLWYKSILLTEECCEKALRHYVPLHILCMAIPCFVIVQMFQEHEVGIVHVTLLSVTSGAKHSSAPARSPKPACIVAALTL